MGYSHVEVYLGLGPGMAFSVAARRGKRELVVRRETLGEEEARGMESGEDESIYSVTTLNHLQLTGFAGLSHVSPRISQLNGLLQLILTHNGLQDLPDEIRVLTKLKHLDASHNHLTVLPQALYGLPSLHTLILGHNQLTNPSFPPLPEGTDQLLPALHHTDLTNNQLTQLPALVYKSTSISELLASDNPIGEISPTIGSLSALKQLEMKRSKLTALPFELTACGKLKTLALEDNSFKDRRLMKLVAQHGAQKPKAVLEYIASHSPRPAAEEKPSGKRKGGKKKAAKEVPVKVMEDSDSDVEFSEVKPVVRVLRPSAYVEVRVSPGARKVRPYLVCAVVRGLQLGEQEAFREFITLQVRSGRGCTSPQLSMYPSQLPPQTKLHDTVCKRRRVATIATHDLSKLSLPLSYSCAPADAISILPLGGGPLVIVRDFLARLEANRPERGGGGRRAKPQDPAAAVLSK